MKKLLLALVAIISLQATASAFEDKVITKEELPRVARVFLDKYFTDTKISLITVDNEVFDKDYKVIFENGGNIEFNAKGQWTEVDCGMNTIPNGIITNKIQSYISTNFASLNCVKIEHEDRGGYEVKLSNGIALVFNSSEKFVGTDD